jgi:16S rRNA (uracil1498-N3)-methyltransferase
MRQFLLPDFVDSKIPLIIDKKETHYLKNVLRYDIGIVFNAIDQNGKKWKAKITEFKNKNAIVLLFEEKEKIGDNIKFPEIFLYQAFLKGKKMDIVVRQAVEAGVSSIIPLETEFSIGKMENSDTDGKRKRWDKICKEAMQQSGSSIVSKVEGTINIMNLPKQITHSEKEIVIFFHQEKIEDKTMHNYLSDDVDKISIIIGPEGGFSCKEVVFLKEQGFLPAYLGKNILKAETAAIYSVAAVKTILLEKNAWILR